jgi:hypothetical protein
MEANAWEMLVRPLMVDVAMSYVALVAIVLLAKVASMVVKAVGTARHRGEPVLRVVPLPRDPSATRPEASRTTRRRPAPVLVHRPEAPRMHLVVRSS